MEKILISNHSLRSSDKLETLVGFRVTNILFKMVIGKYTLKYLFHIAQIGSFKEIYVLILAKYLSKKY